MSEQTTGSVKEAKGDRASKIKNALDIATSFIGLMSALGLVAGATVMFTYAKNEGFSFLDMAQNAPIGILAISLLFASYGVIVAFCLLGTMHAPYVMFRLIWPEPKADGSCHDRLLLRTDIYADGSRLLAGVIFGVSSLIFFLLLCAVVRQQAQKFDIESMGVIGLLGFIAFFSNMLLFDRSVVVERKWLWLIAPCLMLAVVLFAFSTNIARNTMIAVGARPHESSHILVTHSNYDRLERIAENYALDITSCEIPSVGFILQSGTIILNGFGDKTLLRIGTMENGRIIRMDSKEIEVLSGQAHEVKCISSVGSD